jgi:hypothetical protein
MRSVAIAACIPLVVLTGCALRRAPAAAAPRPETLASVGTPAAAIPNEPPAQAGVGAIGGWLAAGVERPAVQTIRFDVDALPVAEWGPAARKSRFVLQPRPGGYSLRIWPRIFAEVVVSYSGPSAGGGKPSFTSFTGQGFGVGAAPGCGAGHKGTRMAAWSGFAPEEWTEDGMNVEMGAGDYDLATCRARPMRSLFGRARAIVRGFVYALRARETDDDGHPQESLVVFLPRGAMVSAAADPASTVQAANTGPFTRLTFPLREASAGTTSVRLSPVSMALWSRLQKQLPVYGDAETQSYHDDLLVGIDVACQKDRRLGSIAVALPEGPLAKPYAKLVAALR